MLQEFIVLRWFLWFSEGVYISKVARVKPYVLLLEDLLHVCFILFSELCHVFFCLFPIVDLIVLPVIAFLYWRLPHFSSFLSLFLHFLATSSFFDVFFLSKWLLTVVIEVLECQIHFLLGNKVINLYQRVFMQGIILLGLDRGLAVLRFVFFTTKYFSRWSHRPFIRLTYDARNSLMRWEWQSTWSAGSIYRMNEQALVPCAQNSVTPRCCSLKFFGLSLF